MQVSAYKGKFGSNDIQNSIKGWLENFEHFGFSNKNILNTLLNNIRFIYDYEILDNFDRFISNIGIDFNNIYIGNFGIKDESSHRLIGKINNLKTYIDIHELLCNVNPNNTICFVDDFLISGGQFISIIQSFFSENDNRKELNLSRKEIEIFDKINKIFYFYMGTNDGLSKAIDILKYYKLNKNSKIRIANKFIIDETFFGKISKDNEFCIGKTIFSSCTENEDIKYFYTILKEVGIQLLKQNKPHWAEDRINNSFLGYGNSGQLLCGEYNVPTCTLTSLWMEGDITLNGNNFKWKPLVCRKEKKLLQTEHIG